MARGGGRCPQSLRRVLGRGLRLLRILRVCAKTSTGQEAYFEQKDPHPDSLPSDGRGNSKIRLLRIPKRLDKPTDGGRFSLSHPYVFTVFPSPVAQPLKSISICPNRRGPRRFRVAQIGNLLFRRLAVGRRRRITNPRHSRLPVCATGVAVLVRCAVAVNTYPVRREREQPDRSLAASKAVGYADRRRTILPLPSDGRGPG